MSEKLYQEHKRYSEQSALELAQRGARLLREHGVPGEAALLDQDIGLVRASLPDAERLRAVLNDLLNALKVADLANHPHIRDHWYEARSLLGNYD